MNTISDQMHKHTSTLTLVINTVADINSANILKCFICGQFFFKPQNGADFDQSSYLIIMCTFINFTLYALKYLETVIKTRTKLRSCEAIESDRNC